MRLSDRESWTIETTEKSIVFESSEKKVPEKSSVKYSDTCIIKHMRTVKFESY